MATAQRQRGVRVVGSGVERLIADEENPQRGQVCSSLATHTLTLQHHRAAVTKGGLTQLHAVQLGEVYASILTITHTLQN